MITILFSVLAIFFILYFIILQILSPQTFLGTFFGFSIIWFLLSIFFAILAILSYKKVLKKIFFSIKKQIRIFLGIIISLGLIICFIILGIINNPKFPDKKSQNILTQQNENPEYVIILGGGITKDKKLSLTIQERLKTSAEYLKNHPNAIAVVTGGKGKYSPCPESVVLKSQLKSLGIQDSRILEENGAKDTIQNFQKSVILLSEYTQKSVQEILSSRITIITSKFHIRRAEILAERMGFTNLKSVYSKTPTIFVLNSYAREICAYIKLSLRILFTNEPKNILN